MNNICDELVVRKIAENNWHAAGMLNKLKCFELKTDAERLARCELYKAWKMAGENKSEAARKAIAGEVAPVPLIPLHDVTETL